MGLPMGLPEITDLPLSVLPSIWTHFPIFFMHMDGAGLLHIPEHWWLVLKYRRSLRTTPKNITRNRYKVTLALMTCWVAHIQAGRPQRNRRLETVPSQGIFIGTIKRCTPGLVFDRRKCRISARPLIRMVKHRARGQL